ncbi:glycosyltransferase involved in cell wall biosynthesis [Aquimarina sp. EL_43]|uniref:glycosyltransferase family 4 protein n=1 Tax=unclassified Aquimarina TaxID=2627091 RepID=UPI0018C94C9C|nr:MULTISPECIES: glycosyltransferase family 1 protein [unclassified Aquimarina]MBG6132341.1 glycosyltransferase involved in cell wall biosynthesis [Aquimarina sp. EL_35]MBG6152472.1 glycosyltransferase involved in cell wall biosynthesis [Aquimarina sp. EL_32]MBG6170601.1 glycosyltransferase involved in cell wall biosynthesis [Aquimarina sp. EL_43]
MKNKRVFVDFHYLKNLNKGFGQFSYHLSKAFSSIDTDLNYVFYTPKKGGYKSIFNQKNIFVKYYYSIHRQLGVFGRNYIFHSTNQLSKIEPSNKKIPYVLTIHDINFMYEDTVDQKTKDFIQKKIDRAQVLVFVSHFTKDEVNKHFNVTASKTQKVIYNGNSLKETSLVDPEKSTDDYLFCITEMRPYKNLEKLILMMNHIPEKFKLILAGKGSSDYVLHLKNVIKENKLEDRVFLKGIVSEETKVKLFSNCFAFVFPSSREGFGLPVVEALNFNKPIFLYNKTSLPEIGGEACFYWEELGPEYMADVFLTKITYFESNRLIMEEKIKTQLEKFSWQTAALEYNEIYKSLM